MSGIEDWDPVPASNTAAPPVGAPENHDRTDVNDIAREMMASTRADWEGSATGGGEFRNLLKDETLLFVSGTVVDVVGVDVTAFFPEGRKIRVLHSSGSDAYCFVVSSAFTTNTRITVADFDSAGANAIGAAVNQLQIHNSFGGGFGILSGAFETAGGALYEIPASTTAAGINAAIALAQSSGKIVLLEDDTYHLEAAVVMQTGVSLVGRGMRGSSTLKVEYDGYAITSGLLVSNFTLRDFTIDGDASARAAGGGISLGDRHQGVLIEDLFITDVWEYGITTVSPGTTEVGVVIRDVEVDSSGDNAFNITDPSARSTRSFFSGLISNLPGSGGKASATACGLWLEGEAMVSDVTVRLSPDPVASTRTGIRLEQVGVAGSPDGAHKCVLNGFRVVGDGATEIGLFVGGEECVVSNGFVELTGASAKPLLVDGRGGSPEQASDNHISGVRFSGGLRCEIAPDAVRTEIADCVFDGQSSVGLAVSGNDTIVKGCTVLGGQTIGIQVAGGALDVEISGCSVRDTTADGVNIQSGSNDCVISDCTLRDTGGDGVQIDAGADRARVVSSVFDTTAVDGVVVGSDDVAITGCTFRGVLGDGVQVNAGADRTRILSNVFDTISGSDVSDGGTDTVIRNNIPQVNETVIQGVNQTGFGSVEVIVTGMGDIAYPGPGANGTRRFIVHSNVLVNINAFADEDIAFRLRSGPLGSLSDPTFTSGTSFGMPVDQAMNGVLMAIVTPDANDTLTVSVDAVNRTDNDIKGGLTFLHIRYLDG